MKIWNQAEEEPSTSDIVDLMVLISGFNNLKVALTSEEIESNTQLDHEENPEYQAAVSEEVDAILNEQEMPVSESSEGQPSTSSQDTSNNQTETVFAANFDQHTTYAAQSACFDNIFKSSLDIDSQLASIHAETGAGPHFDAIKTSFEQFQKTLRKGMN